MPKDFSISPFKFKGTWVFDAPNLGLDKEAFVQGADTIVETIGRGLRNPEDGFIVHFTDDDVSDVAHYRLTWIRGEFGGNWYMLDGYGIHGWLCPALFKFFPSAPKHIYVWVENECLVNQGYNKLKKIFSLKKPNVMPS